MRTVGIIATSFVGVVAVIGVIITLTLIPDIRRYMRIRNM